MAPKPMRAWNTLVASSSHSPRGTATRTARPSTVAPPKAATTGRVSTVRSGTVNRRVVGRRSSSRPPSDTVRPAVAPRVLKATARGVWPKRTMASAWATAASATSATITAGRDSARAQRCATRTRDTPSRAMPSTYGATMGATDA